MIKRKQKTVSEEKEKLGVKLVWDSFDQRAGSFSFCYCFFPVYITRGNAVKRVWEVREGGREREKVFARKHLINTIPHASLFYREALLNTNKVCSSESLATALSYIYKMKRIIPIFYYTDSSVILSLSLSLCLSLEVINIRKALHTTNVGESSIRIHSLLSFVS